MECKKFYESVVEHLMTLPNIKGNVSVKVLNDTSLELAWDSRCRYSTERRTTILKIYYHEPSNSFEVFTLGVDQPTVTVTWGIIDNTDTLGKELAHAISIYILSGSVGRLVDFFVLG